MLKIDGREVAAGAVLTFEADHAGAVYTAASLERLLLVYAERYPLGFVEPQLLAPEGGRL